MSILSWIREKVFGIKTFPSLDALVYHYKDNPEGLAYWILQSIDTDENTPDEEILTEAKLTFSRGHGDCWDKASLMYYGLWVWGWNCYLLCAYPQDKMEGHAVCVYTDKTGKIWYVSNGYVYEALSPSPREIALQFMPDMVEYEIEKFAAKTS